MGFGKCIVIHRLPWYCIERFHPPKIPPPVSPLFIIYTSSNNALQSLLFSVLIILPFPECHMYGIVQYVAF